ncbi:NAD-dependent DNA ligase LigA [Candidatus Pelagibacter sp. Uisw_121]|uniref:NAD-dependent DNA ligase LigA n=1 Tax=Candidatus Pelagibacter sp. Uisw_121 TaxID=3230987 RepID=UPI0039ECF660
MNDALVRKDYLKKIRKIHKLNKAYYEDSVPVISDQEYDSLKQQIIDLENKYKFLKSKLSPSISVGFKPSKNFKKIKHKVPMLSLGNAFNEEDLRNFEKKIINFLSLKDTNSIEYSAEPKIDGISASLIYVNGKLIKGLSRGDGNEGEDITQNLKTIKDIPLEITKNNFPEEIDIRGEVFIENDDFKKINAKFANPRNAASGSLRQKNSLITSEIPLRFIAYTYGYEKKMKINNQTSFLENLKLWGFKINPFNKKIIGVKNLILNHRELEEKRKELAFDIDGIVYKVNDFALQKRLGFAANAPRWAIAHKFSANSSISEIMNIEIQIGRTGALTPVAKIKPVNIGGVIVSNATLHNEDEIIRKDIRIGDTVTVERAGDVIPHVVLVDLKKRKQNSKKFIFPLNCPSCGSKTIKDYNEITKKQDAVRRCASEGFECEKIAIERIKHFISKDAFNIDGFGKKIVENFWNLKLVRLPQDIFQLNYDKIEELEGWGKLSVANLKFSIEEKRNISLERFIYSLGIRHIGQENAKLIARHLKTSLNFFRLSKENNIENLFNIDGIGITQIQSIKKFFLNKTNLKVLFELEKKLLIKNVILANNNGLLKNKTFMLTGKLNGISRAEAKSLIEQNSGKIISNVNKKLDYLIAGDKPTLKKINTAKEWNIKIINQTEWLKMLNKSG